MPPFFPPPRMAPNVRGGPLVNCSEVPCKTQCLAPFLPPPLIEANQGHVPKTNPKGLVVWKEFKGTHCWALKPYAEHKIPPPPGLLPPIPPLSSVSKHLSLSLGGACYNQCLAMDAQLVWEHHCHWPSSGISFFLGAANVFPATFAAPSAWGIAYYQYSNPQDRFSSASRLSPHKM